MPEIYNPPDMSPYKALQQAFAARNVLSPRSPGRKMSADMTGTGMITSLPGNADGWMDMRLEGLSLKNELNYTPATWAEWTKSAGATGDSTGLEFTYVETGTLARAYCSTTLKGNTKYLILFSVVSNTLATKSLQLSNNLTGSYMTMVEIGQVGNVKRIITTQETITLNEIRFTQSNLGDGGLKVKLAPNIRIYELPSGSQIETDANTLTADQLALRYPYLQGGAVRDVQGQRVRSVGKNLFNTDAWYKFLKLGTETTYPTSRGYEAGYDYIKANPAGHYTKQFMKGFFKPNTQYVLTYDTKADANSKTGLKIQYTDGTSLSYLSTTSWESITLTSAVGKTINYICLAYSDISYGYFANIQLEQQSTVATTKEPYRETVSYIPGPLRSLPNGVRDKSGVQNVQTYTLKASDFGQFNQFENVDQVVFNKSILQGFIYPSTNDSVIIGSVKADGFGECTVTSGTDNAAYINTIATRVETANFRLILEKGKYANLAAAQAALSGTVIRYQLTTPVETRYKDPGALYAEPNGTIITEPCAHGCKSPAYGTGKIAVTTADAPISSIESVYRIDTQADGSQIEVDVTSSFTLDADKLGITGTGTDPNKPYEYVCLIDPAYSTVPPITYSYPEADALALGVASHSYGSAAADWVLTTAESQCGVLVATLASGAANIIAPDRSGTPYWVQNDSGYTLTIKKSGGTGATVATGKKALVIHTGGDYVKFSEI